MRTKPGVDETDERDEEADPDADRRLELDGDRAEHGLPEPGEDEHQDDESLEDDDPHRVRPGHAWQARDREGDHGVETETRGEREREVGDDSHEDGEDAGDERCGGGDHREVRLGATTEVVAGAVRDGAEDDGVEHDDVAHREERHQSAAHLGADGRASLGDLEELVDRILRLAHGGSCLSHGDDLCTGALG